MRDGDVPSSYTPRMRREVSWCGSKYTLGPELGRGGMATVHFGVALGDLGFAKPVAIKRIHPTLVSDPAMVALLRDEARVVARIRHPNVVSILDVVASGVELGLVLDYVHGESLSGLIRIAFERKERLPTAVAVSIAIDLLYGLDAAHAATDELGQSLGIVHRDVSPHNVIVGVDGVARVLDFGVAKAHRRSSVTRNGEIKGKLAYMAPEQIGGDADARADVYAAGLVLWEMIVGFSPFASATTDSELLARVLGGLTTAPSDHRPEVSGALDDVVRKATASSLPARFASAREAASALEALGLAASRGDVAAVVACLAEDVLRERQLVVTALELPAISVTPQNVGSSGSPPDAPVLAREPTAVPPTVARRRTAFHAVPIASLVLAVLAGAVLVRRSHALGRSGSPELAAELPPPPALAVSVAAPPITETGPVARPAQAATGSPHPRKPARAPTRPSETARVNCTIPYVIDSAGIQRYRRECFPE